MRKRNIILVTLESVRADHCSFMGYNRDTTPTLDRMVRKGVCFEKAYAPGPRTPTSIIGVFTGELMSEYIECNSEKNRIKNIRLNLRKRKTLAESLLERGYSTGAFNPSTYASRYFGFEKGFSFFEDFLFNESIVKKLFVKGGHITFLLRNIREFLLRQGAFKVWESYYDNILNWMDKTTKPFFLWVFLLDTHFPYMTPRKYRKWTNIFDMYYLNWKLYKVLFENNIEFSEKQRKKIINAYDNSIYYADNFLKNLIKDVTDHDPIIIVHSDHGEAFGERGMYGHSYPYLYEENIHVPLVIWNADIKEKIRKPTSLLNLYLTIIGLADGKYLNELPLIRNDNKVVLSKDIGWKPAKGINWKGPDKSYAIIMGKWKYIRMIYNNNIKEELYDLGSDPNEQNNLINEHPKLLKEMRKIVDARVNYEIEEKKIVSISSKLKYKLLLKL